MFTQGDYFVISMIVLSFLFYLLAPVFKRKKAKLDSQKMFFISPNWSYEYDFNTVLAHSVAGYYSDFTKKPILEFIPPNGEGKRILIILDFDKKGLFVHLVREGEIVQLTDTEKARKMTPGKAIESALILSDRTDLITARGQSIIEFQEQRSK
jgi:hypothetical protein